MPVSRKHYLPALAIALTLGFGLLLGTLASRGVRAARPGLLATDATPLPAPSPAELSNSFADVAARLDPTVVNINTESTVQIGRRGGSPGQEPFDDFFNKFFHGQPGWPPHGFRQRSLGSGIILDPKGYILTNDHVITQSIEDRPVDRITVYLHGDDATKYPAKIIGADKDTDLAVIKIDAGKPLAYARLGDSDSMRVGDWVLAIGSPFGLEATVTAGIISAKGRDIEPGEQGQFKRFLQTDAAINPGNSGGPLVNLAGQVIGVNTAIATNGGASDGVGFAIPSNTARKVYNVIITTGKVRRGAIGVTFSNDPEQNAALLRSFGADHGVVVNSVQKGSPADRAGLKMGDVITSIQGRAIKDGDDLVQIISNSPIGAPVEMDYLRNGQPRAATVQVGDRDAIVAEERQQAVPGGNESSPAETAGPLGASVRDLTPDQAKELAGALRLTSASGVLVTDLDPMGFAADLGVERGDVILSVNHAPLKSADDFRRAQAGLKSGSDVLLLVARRSGRAFQTLFLADRLP